MKEKKEETREAKARTKEAEEKTKEKTKEAIKCRNEYPELQSLWQGMDKPMDYVEEPMAYEKDADEDDVWRAREGFRVIPGRTDEERIAKIYEDMSGDPAKWPKGDKTLDDYMALPDDRRVELIDGAFYDMAAPNTKHGAIADEILYLLKDFVYRNGGNCIPKSAPVDVQLDCDDKTIVQPDVFVICDRKKINELRIFGAPDMVVEIVSQSNWKMDVIKKKDKYQRAGVKEYWIVFPEDKKVLVHLFAIGEMREYSFEDKVPVYIWGGKCEIDFKRLWEKVAEAYD